MTPDNWKLVEQLFESVVDLPAPSRDKALETVDPEIRAEVLALLQADAEAAHSLSNRVSDGVRNLHEDSATTAHAGPYRLKKEIGQGGMGTVYLAERDDGQYQGEVAIKLLRPGMDTGIFLDRFKRERQALAKLQHPNIARLLDSGATADGSQFIAMELIHGQPINTYCKEHNLSPKAILELFLPVCRAVAYAHQQLIVHRDLKPGNILVTPDGSPRLLDFGICKSLDDIDPSVTATGAHMLTPDFASPEQVRGDTITPASDIYGLGAVLYLLLTGRSPHAIEKYNAIEIARAICDDPPLPPNISPDIDTILSKALQKDPARRYASAEQLAEDLRRVLANEPVLARPDTALYRATKFVRRHPIGVVATTAVLLALTLGLVAYARQAAIAKRQSAEARRLANAIIFNIHDKIQTLNGSLPARQEIVKLGLDYLDRLSADSSADPDLRREIAAAYYRMGNVQGDIFVAHTGDVKGALASYRKGLASLEGVPPTRESRIVQVDLLDRTAMILSTRDIPEATRLYESALPIAQQLAKEAPADRSAQRRLAICHSQFALLLRQPDPPRALQNSTAAVTILRNLLKAEPDSADLREILASALSSTGSVQVQLNQTEAACDSYREAISHRQYFVEKSPDNSRAARMLMLAYGHLGDALGNSPEAASPYASMLAIAERSHAANPGDHTAAFDLAMALSRVAALPGKPISERLALYNRALPEFQTVTARDPDNRLFRSNYFLHSEAAAELHLTNNAPIPARAILDRLHRDIQPKDLSQPTIRRIAITVRQKLALLALTRKDPQTAQTLAREALAIVEKAEKGEKTANDRLIRFTAYATMARTLPPPEARQWRGRAIAGFTSLQSDPAFRPSHREELRRLQAIQ